VLQRIDAAWYGALTLLAIGIVASLLKGLDWREALVLAGMFAAIFASRRHFYRKSSLLQEPLSPSWLIMIAVVIAGTTWLGLLLVQAHRVFPRTVVAVLLQERHLALPALAGGDRRSGRRDAGRHLLGVRRPEALSTTMPEELDQAMPVIRHAAQTQGFLALLGDKALFWSDDRQAFISYVATRHYWIVMGDPVGRRVPSKACCGASAKRQTATARKSCSIRWRSTTCRSTSISAWCC
jgi:phosphatidylglycerol lysyltransferase